MHFIYSNILRVPLRSSSFASSQWRISIGSQILVQNLCHYRVFNVFPSLSTLPLTDFGGLLAASEDLEEGDHIVKVPVVGIVGVEEEGKEDEIRYKYKGTELWHS